MNSLCNIQGKRFKINKFKFLELFNNKEGFVEGNTTIDEEMKQLEIEFTGKLQHYGVIYDEYIKEKMVSDIDISSLLGQTAKSNGLEYYISRKGVIRELKWKHQKHGCLAPSRNITASQLTKLIPGVPLKKTFRGKETIYEKCTDPHIDKTGKVIRNLLTKDTAWLADKGTKHKFIQGDSRHTTCPNGIEEEIGDIKYSMIKSGGDLGPTNECIRETLTKQGVLTKLNNELMDIAVKMKGKITMIDEEVAESNNNLKVGTTGLDDIIKTLNSDRDDIQKLKKEIFSLDGNVRDNRYLVNASNMQYVGWGVSLITVFVLGLYTMKK
jgi:hypothetical protein